MNQPLVERRIVLPLLAKRRKIVPGCISVVRLGQIFHNTGLQHLFRLCIVAVDIVDLSRRYTDGVRHVERPAYDDGFRQLIDARPQANHFIVQLDDLVFRRLRVASGLTLLFPLPKQNRYRLFVISLFVLIGRDAVQNDLKGGFVVPRLLVNQVIHIHARLVIRLFRNELVQILLRNVEVRRVLRLLIHLVIDRNRLVENDRVTRVLLQAAVQMAHHRFVGLIRIDRLRILVELIACIKPFGGKNDNRNRQRPERGSRAILNDPPFRFRYVRENDIPLRPGQNAQAKEDNESVQQIGHAEIDQGVKKDRNRRHKIKQRHGPFLFLGFAIGAQEDDENGRNQPDNRDEADNARFRQQLHEVAVRLHARVRVRLVPLVKRFPRSCPGAEDRMLLPDGQRVLIHRQAFVYAVRLEVDAFHPFANDRRKKSGEESRENGRRPDHEHADESKRQRRIGPPGSETFGHFRHLRLYVLGQRKGCSRHDNGNADQQSPIADRFSREHRDRIESHLIGRRFLNPRNDGDSPFRQRRIDRQRQAYADNGIKNGHDLLTERKHRQSGYRDNGEDHESAAGKGEEERHDDRHQHKPVKELREPAARAVDFNQYRDPQGQEQYGIRIRILKDRRNPHPVLRRERIQHIRVSEQRKEAVKDDKISENQIYGRKPLQYAFIIGKQYPGNKKDEQHDADKQSVFRQVGGTRLKRCQQVNQRNDQSGNAERRVRFPCRILLHDMDNAPADNEERHKHGI